MISSHSSHSFLSQETTSLSVSIDLPHLDILYKENNAMYSLLWLASFTEHNVACINILVLLLKLYGYSIFYLSIHQSNICVIYTFCLLQILLLWKFVCKFLHTHVFNSLGYVFGSRIAGHMATLCLTFWDIARLPDCSQRSCTISVW